MKIIIGHDRYGKELSEGDICKYTITDQNGVINKYKGLIEYDSAEYAFVFNQLEEDFPVVMMNKVNMDTIEKIINVYHLDSSFPDCSRWVDIYNERFDERLRIK